MEQNKENINSNFFSSDNLSSTNHLDLGSNRLKELKCILTNSGKFADLKVFNIQTKLQLTSDSGLNNSNMNKEIFQVCHQDDVSLLFSDCDQSHEHCEKERLPLMEIKNFPGQNHNNNFQKNSCGSYSNQCKNQNNRKLVQGKLVQNIINPMSFNNHKKNDANTLTPVIQTNPFEVTSQQTQTDLDHFHQTKLDIISEKIIKFHCSCTRYRTRFIHLHEVATQFACCGNCEQNSNFNEIIFDKSQNEQNSNVLMEMKEEKLKSNSNSKIVDKFQTVQQSKSSTHQKEFNHFNDFHRQTSSTQNITHIADCPPSLEQQIDSLLQKQKIHLLQQTKQIEENELIDDEFLGLEFAKSLSIPLSKSLLPKFDNDVLDFFENNNVTATAKEISIIADDEFDDKINTIQNNEKYDESEGGKSKSLEIVEIVEKTIQELENAKTDCLELLGTRYFELASFHRYSNTSEGGNLVKSFHRYSNTTEGCTLDSKPSNFRTSETVVFPLEIDEIYNSQTQVDMSCEKSSNQLRVAERERISKTTRNNNKAFVYAASLSRTRR